MRVRQAEVHTQARRAVDDVLAHLVDLRVELLAAFREQQQAASPQVNATQFSFEHDDAKTELCLDGFDSLDKRLEQLADVPAELEVLGGDLPACLQLGGHHDAADYEQPENEPDEEAGEELPAGERQATAAAALPSKGRLAGTEGSYGPTPPRERFMLGSCFGACRQGGPRISYSIWSD